MVLGGIYFIGLWFSGQFSAAYSIKQHFEFAAPALHDWLSVKKNAVPRTISEWLGQITQHFEPLRSPYESSQASFAELTMIRRALMTPIIICNRRTSSLDDFDISLQRLTAPSRMLWYHCCSNPPRFRQPRGHRPAPAIGQPPTSTQCPPQPSPPPSRLSRPRTAARPRISQRQRVRVSPEPSHVRARSCRRLRLHPSFIPARCPSRMPEATSLPP